MSWLRLLVVVGVVAAEASAAIAADMPSALPPPDFAPPQLIDLNYGWYLRGDLGYAWGTIGGAQSSTGFPNPIGNTLGSGFIGGIGVGIKTKWLRTDVTIDYTAPLKYTGSAATVDDTTAKVTAVTALFNGYLDLGTWYRVTPYLGAGVGAAQLHTSDYVSTGAPPFATGLSNTQWNFAWALMGGVGYPVAPNAMIDVGYRYVNFGDVTTASDSFGATTLRNLAAHEVRVGFRWSFDDLSVAH